MSADPVVHVIDDDEAVRQSLDFLLQSARFKTRTYETALAFLNALPDISSGCIVTDVKMPEVSGPEFYAAVKRKGAALEQRLIFVTGDLMNAETLKFIESTGRAWLGKPFDIAAITRTISECLNEVGSAVKE